MEFVLKDLVTKCWWSWGSLVLAIVLAVILGQGMWSDTIAGPHKGWMGLLLYAAIVGFFAKPLFLAAKGGHRHLLTVCIWSALLVVLLVPFTFFVFYAFFGEQTTKYDKALNVLPVVVAIWAAALGWLIHFQLSTKAHRTNNSFSILMETRKSGEFLKRAELVSKHFPPGTTQIDTSYHQYFDPASIANLYQGAPADKLPDSNELEKAEAVNALKYLLNYYEFMAVGIRAGDLDEKLLYDTIGPPVVNVFKRAAEYVDYLNNKAKDKQTLTFIVLRHLVDDWANRIQIDEARVRANGGKL